MNVFSITVRYEKISNYARAGVRNISVILYRKVQATLWKALWATIPPRKCCTVSDENEGVLMFVNLLVPFSSVESSSDRTVRGSCSIDCFETWYQVTFFDHKHEFILKVSSFENPRWRKWPKMLFRLLFKRFSEIFGCFFTNTVPFKKLCSTLTWYLCTMY